MIGELAQTIAERGTAIGLPLVAACADISSARPFALGGETPVGALFDFNTEAGHYWQRGDLALHNGIVSILRWTAEPFFYDEGRIDSWRPLRLSPDLEQQAGEAHFNVHTAIVAPVHLPGSVVGAVIWATDRRGFGIRAAFDRHAADLHLLALRFISACDAAAHGEPEIVAHHLTRREIQCLKLAAAGKTDGEIATILDLAAPTIRFHLKKASAKLGENGRLRTVQHATALGFVSIRP